MLAALTAVPMTGMERPATVTRSPTSTPSAVAKPRSTTTPPGRTQVPEVTRGRSTGPGFVSEAVITTCEVEPFALSFE